MTTVQPVPAAILAATTDARTQLAMLMGSYLEGGWGPTYSVGDAGTSFGPYQMHEGGALDSLAGPTLADRVTQAQDAGQATAAMLGRYQAAVQAVPADLWNSNPEQAGEEAAYRAESPALTYYASQGSSRVTQAYQAATAVQGGTPVQVDPNATSVSSTPVTVTQGPRLHLLPEGFPLRIGPSILTDSGQSAEFGVRLAEVIGGGILIATGLVLLAYAVVGKDAGQATSAVLRPVGWAGQKRADWRVRATPEQRRQQADQDRKRLEPFTEEDELLPPRADRPVRITSVSGKKVVGRVYDAPSRRVG